MGRGGRWSTVDRIITIVSIITGLIGSGAMGWFTSLEHAPWPVVILAASMAFFFAGGGTLAFSLALRHWANPMRTAWARISLGASIPTIDDAVGVGALVDEGVGLVTVIWSREFADANYLVSVQADRCAANVERRAKGSVSLWFHKYSDEDKGTDPQSFSVLAMGRRARWWH
jgi:hypothetical protein